MPSGFVTEDRLDEVADLATPYIILPSQFMDSRKSWTGEERLAFAVLEDAIRVYQGVVRKLDGEIGENVQGQGGWQHLLPRHLHSKRVREAWEEARAWLLDGASDPYAFSCADICDFLEIDLSALQIAVRAGTGVIARRRPVVTNSERISAPRAR